MAGKRQMLLPLSERGAGQEGQFRQLETRQFHFCPWKNQGVNFVGAHFWVHKGEGD